MVEFARWWLVIEVMGLIALPIALRFLRYLPDRGYIFAKPLGLLLTSYLFWLAVSFHIFRNEAVTILFFMALIAAFSAYLYRQNRQDITDFIRSQKTQIILLELIFTIALAAWAIFRAYNPALDSTERPMDLAFLNSILRSETFPPNDPWLSGFGLSYYYFGYLMMAVLTKLSGLPGAIAFNLAVALLFALAIAESFSLVYNLIRKASASRIPAKRDLLSSPNLFAFLGSLFTVIIGNLHGFFDALRASGGGSEALWNWLDLKKIADAPVTGKFFPSDPPDPWWWWRASRVIHDRDLLGRDSEVIDEFPFFSFLLGDMHPHVLGLPFVLLALAIALNVLFSFVRSTAPESEAEDSSSSLERLLNRASSILRLHAFDILLWALCLGGLSFLNTWDFPIYLFIFLAALALRHYLDHKDIDWIELGIFAGWVSVLGIVLYLPFYIGFRSQAGGILPVLYNVTKLQQYLVMFGFFIFILISTLIYQWRETFGLKDERGEKWLARAEVLGKAWRVIVLVILIPLLALAMSVALIAGTQRGRAFLQELTARPEVQEALGGQDIGALLRRFALMRLQDPWMFLLLVVMIAGFALLFWYRLRAAKEFGALNSPTESKKSGAHPEEEKNIPLAANLSVLFVALLAVTALLLTLATEFVYLRDFFGTRMNTIFKFWYQAWVQMAIASAFGVWYVLQGRRQLGKYIWLVAFLALFGMSLIYPIAASYSKAQQFSVQPTLNGTAYMQERRPADYAAIQWLQNNTQGAPTILEAPGGSYTEYARVSAQTGLPTVLGWDFHEQQWRGNYDEPGKRIPDIEKIYKSLDRNIVADLLDKYGIQYVYISDLERAKYSLQSPMIDKFGRFMDLVYDQGGVRIYRRR
jgi:YYY domain-containing protein